MYQRLFAAVLMTMGMSTAALAHGDGVLKEPPQHDFKKVSGLVHLPDFLPGMGTLYVNPATLPAGPFLGYDRQGRLVNVIYMIPVADLQNKKAFTQLGQAVAGLKIDHTDLEYNPGHPGVDNPHYHITQWLIPHAEHQQRLK